MFFLRNIAKSPFIRFVPYYGILLAALLIFSKSTANSAEPNIAILRELAIKAGYALLENQGLNSGDTISIEIVPGQEGIFIKSGIASAAYSKGVIVKDSASNAVNVKIVINRIGVEYRNIESERDSVERLLICSISGLSKKTGIVTPIPDLLYMHRDTLGRSEILNIESKSYAFAHSEVPPPQPSFIRSVAEPVLLITSALVTVILLFTLRSN